jgi:hypothetical protein
MLCAMQSKGTLSASPSRAQLLDTQAAIATGQLLSDGRVPELVSYNAFGRLDFVLEVCAVDRWPSLTLTRPRNRHTPWWK